MSKRRIVALITTAALIFGIPTGKLGGPCRLATEELVTADDHRLARPREHAQRLDRDVVEKPDVFVQVVGLRRVRDQLGEDRGRNGDDLRRRVERRGAHAALLRHRYECHGLENGALGSDQLRLGRLAADLDRGVVERVDGSRQRGSGLRPLRERREGRVHVPAERDVQQSRVRDELLALSRRLRPVGERLRKDSAVGVDHSVPGHAREHGRSGRLRHRASRPGTVNLQRLVVGDNAMSYAYQWKDCDSSGTNCAAVAGATSARYTLGAADQGRTVRAQVTASNTAGSTSASSAQTGMVQAAPAPPPAATGLHVSGNQLLDARRKRRASARGQLLGPGVRVHSGLGDLRRPSDAASVQALASWKVNIVRLPLNEDCWLGINGVPSAYAGANYRNAIVSYVILMHQYGIYAELSLIWGAPGTYQATSQPGSPDEDHSPAFWSSLASTFKNDPKVILAPWGETIVTRTAS